MAVKEPTNKVYEKELLESVSRTHSVTAFLQSYGIDIILYGSVFVAGYNKAGPLWMIPPIFFLVVKDVWSAERENKRFSEIIKTLRDEKKELILADPNQLPPWVHYPDVERCNWVNKLLSQFWPFISVVLTEKIKKLASARTVSGLKIQEVSLGSVPPIVSGVKVYDNKVSSSNLITDAMLCYSGDSKFYFSYRGIPGGVENFQLSGPARINFLIIQTLPFIGGVEFSFLGLPQIDFVLTGVGSLGFAEETIRKVINDQITSYLVFPNKFGTVWKEGSEEVIEDPEGVIRINIIEAKDLESKDMALPFTTNKSDPFVEVSYGSKAVYSMVIDESSAPHWDLWCEFVKDNNSTVNIKVKDKDPGSEDLIGSYSLKVSEIKKQGKIDSWVRLDGSKGSVHVRASFLELLPDVKEVKYPPEELSFLSSFILSIHVKSAHNLLLPRSPRKPNSVVQLTVGNDTQETKQVENTDNPVFGQFFNFCVNNPDFNKLRAKVIDEDTKSEIGSFSYSLRKLLDRKNLEIVDQHFPLLDSASDSTIVVSMRLRVIKNVF